MKRIRVMTFAILVLFGIFYSADNAAAVSFSTGLGVDFLNYENGYLSTHAAVSNEVTENVELELGATFGIIVENQRPSFYLPTQIGLGFVFPDFPGAEGILGVGLSPAFNWGEAVGDSRFYMGPYLKAGVRVPVHPFMRWYVDVQQNLLIGPPKWINSSTRVTTGINFSFGSE